MRKIELERQQAEAKAHQESHNRANRAKYRALQASATPVDADKRRRLGIIPPPPHVMPRHKRNHWRWEFVPY